MLHACYILPVFLAVAAARFVNITNLAVPDTLKAGQNAELQCQYTVVDAPTNMFYVKWWWTPLDMPQEKKTLIYQRFINKEPYSTRSDLQIRPNDTIVLMNMQPKYSGTYACEVDDENENIREQQLIVYTPGTGPVVNVTSAKDDATGEVRHQLDCRADGVAPKPELVITVNSQNVEANYTELSASEGLWSAAVSAAVGGRLPDDAAVRCDLYYVNTGVSHEPYYSELTLTGAGGGNATERTAENLERSAPSEPSTTPTPGSSVVHTSWATLLLVAAMAHYLADYTLTPHVLSFN